jgi:hypothetical protein
MSTADHPQTDGQTEVVNRTINWMLRTTLTNDDWESRLVDIEFAYNSLTNRTTGKSPFEITYGYLPLTPATLNSYQSTDPNSPIERFAGVRDAMIVAQQASKVSADQHLTETVYQVGDWVLLAASRTKLSSRTQRTSKAKWQELWRGPFRVIATHGPNAYTLDMPETFLGHPTFNTRFLIAWSADHEVEPDYDHDYINSEEPLDHYVDSAEPTTIDEEEDHTIVPIVDDVIKAPSPVPLIRRSQRGLIPSRRLLEATTERERGGVKQTLLQALSGPLSDKKMANGRNIPKSSGATSDAIYVSRPHLTGGKHV